MSNQLPTVKEYYSKNSQYARLLHLDLNTPCIKPIPHSKNRLNAAINNPQLLELSRRVQKRQAREALKDYLGLGGEFDNYTHLCHRCDHNSQHPDFICINPLHTYVGSASENSKDIINNCPHCGLQVVGRIFFRWHGDNCKYNPNSSRYQKP